MPQKGGTDLVRGSSPTSSAASTFAKAAASLCGATEAMGNRGRVGVPQVSLSV